MSVNVIADGACDLGVSLGKIRLDQLQEAVRANLVSFPSQVPVFIKHAESTMQCHMVLLYFVRGWSCDRIARRYEVTRQHVWQIISEWRRHAVALGYIQVIPPPEALKLPRAAASSGLGPAHRAPFAAEKAEVVPPVRVATSTSPVPQLSTV